MLAVVVETDFELINQASKSNRGKMTTPTHMEIGEDTYIETGQAQDIIGDAMTSVGELAGSTMNRWRQPGGDLQTSIGIAYLGPRIVPGLPVVIDCRFIILTTSRTTVFPVCSARHVRAYR